MGSFNILSQFEIMWVIDYNSIYWLRLCLGKGVDYSISLAPFSGSYPSLLLTPGSFDVPHH